MNEPILKETFKVAHGKRIVFRSAEKVEVEEFSVRRPETNEVLIRTLKTLISPGTERAFLKALPNTPRVFPQYPGYSNIGVILEVGASVKSVKCGDRVASRGGHSSHILMSERKVLKVPSRLDTETALFFSLGSIALQGVRKASLEVGDSVLVIGQGIVGLLAMQLASLSGGMPIITLDLFEERLDLSLRLGADYAFNPRKVDVISEVSKITGGRMVNVVIEASGNPDAVPLALKLAGRFGRVVLLGSPRGESTVNFYRDVHRKGVHLIGAHASLRPVHESFKTLWTDLEDSALILRLLELGKLRVRELITDRFRYDKAEEAYKLLLEERGDVLGIIIDWG